MRPSLKALTAYSPNVLRWMLGKLAKKGSDNPQITITDPAHWHWQSGVIYQKPSYLLRRLNKGAKPHPGIGSKEGHSSKNLVATWKQQPVLSLGAYYQLPSITNLILQLKTLPQLESYKGLALE